MADVDTHPPKPSDGDLEVLPRRGFVPSEREVNGNLADYRFEPLAPPPPREAVPMRRRLVDGLRSMDPRGATAGGPAAPAYLLFVLFMVGSWDDAAFQVLIPEIRDELNFDIRFALVLGTIATLAGQLFGPFAGYLADRVKRVRMVALGGLLANASSVATGLAPSLPLIAASRFTAGAGQDIPRSAGLPLLADWYPAERRGRVFGFVFTGTLLGIFAGPSMAGFIGDRIGWRPTIAGLGVLAVVASLAFATLREPRRGELDRLASGATADAAAVEQVPIGWAEGWRAARSIVTLRRIWYATPFLAAGSNVLISLSSLYYAEEFGASATTRGLIGGIVGGAAMIGVSLAGPVSDRLLAHRPERVFTILAGILLINSAAVGIVAISPSLWLSVAVSLPFFVGGGLITPALFTVTSMVVPARLRGFGVQTIAPWQVLGLVLVIALGGFADAVDTRGAFLSLVPVYLIGSLVIGSAGGGVERDIRAARAAAMADIEADRARRAGASKLVICRDVDVTYDSTQVLFNVDLDIEEGELVALLGTNGAGKSTLLRAIAGIQPASNGAIFLDGQDITHRPAHQNAAGGVVFMPGGRAIFPSLTVAENLRAAGWLYREDEDWLRDRTEHVLGLFPVLRERLDDRAGDLSGGQQQMVALSQAFLMRPRLLMIDELSLGLAPAVVEQLLDIVRSVNEQGTTVVLVEQSVNVALTIARRSVFLDKGEVRFDGPTEELLRRGDLVRSVFLGGAGGGGFFASGTGLRRPKDLLEPEEVLRVEDVQVAFGGRTALASVSLALTGGDVLGVIGPNGAGKTTLFDVISGYVRPDAGTVAVGGSDAAGLGPDARARLGLGRSFQAARLFPALTVRENIAVALEMRLASRSALSAAAWLPSVRRSEQRVNRRVSYLVDLLNLEAYADKLVAELSTGSRRMVDMACIMAAEPRALLLDEPSSGLAQAEVEVLGPVVRRLARETGCGVVVIEHDIPLVTALADRMVAMELGTVLVEGTPSDVVEHPEVIRAYLGASQSTIDRSGSALADALVTAGLMARDHTRTKRSS